MAENRDVGFPEGLPWLPTHVLHDAFGSKEYFRQQKHLQNAHHLKLIAEPLLMESKSILKPRHQKPRRPTGWATGGPGMQAIFLASGQRSCGTGVFLPRRAGIHDFQSPKKPACSSVLLPSRVVQSLNLNVQELGLIVQPQQGLNSSSKGTVECSKRVGKDASKHCCFISKGSSSSPDIFLPKEWTY